mmetsp:Transcript_47898/g.89253  ORF Transcript_47898/g.89253 Transcript_47898/m.89253 type:complete len:205 (+) Transcript_47898:2659-3273(+)
MVVVCLGQSVLHYLFEDVDETGHKALVGPRVRGHDMVQGAERGIHHRRILVAEHLAKAGQVRRDAVRGALEEGVQRQHRLLAHELLGVGQQIQHALHQRGDGLRARQLGRRRQRRARDEMVVIAKILLQRVDNQNDQLVRVVQKKRGGHVPNLLEKQRRFVAHLDGLDISKGGVVPKHVDIQQTQQQLLHLDAVHLRIDEAHLQ